MDHGIVGTEGPQPWLHRLLVAVAAPTQAWSGTDGQVHRDGAQGFFHGDVRVVDRAVLTVDGVEPVHVRSAVIGVGEVVSVAVAREVGDPVQPDSSLRVERRRVVEPGCVTERVLLTSTAAEALAVTVAVGVGCDLAGMHAVKSGSRFTGRPLRADGPGGAAGLLELSEDGVHVRLHGEGARATPGQDARLEWEVDLPARSSVELVWTAEASDERALVAAPATSAGWDVTVEADDRRLSRWVRRAVDDLAGLRLVLRDAPDEPFVGAGAPWFLTLFGRDSLWTARLALPLGTDLAASTLRLLARHQGTAVDALAAEEPGKILHELRRDGIDVPGAPGGRLTLPPRYYGTVDATALWVCLLHDAWAWGLPDEQVADLLPSLEAALGWMATHGDRDGDGFLEYVDDAGTGLANQGWKDSADGVRWRDGSLAAAPLALCEVQGYAHEAALAGATLLEHLGRPGAGRWRAWAARLAERFRESFWVEDDGGPYPAVALDGEKRPVDTLTSNIGHLLGTGLLTAEEEALVAERVAAAPLSSGFGVRTLAAGQGGYSPLSYHGGSVWPHDTAVVLAGLVRGGHDAAAAVLVEGLLAAAEAFDFRLPELYGGDARADLPVPTPYPAACSPQAWSSASAVAVLAAVVGLRPGEQDPRPLRPAPAGAVQVRGLRRGGRVVGVDVTAAGDAVLVQDGA